MEKVTIDYNRLCLELEKQGTQSFMVVYHW